MVDECYAIRRCFLAADNLPEMNIFAVEVYCKLWMHEILTVMQIFVKIVVAYVSPPISKYACFHAYTE
jgi:hypothetical protein